MSKGRLTYPGRGNHFNTVDAKEWEGLQAPGVTGGFWFRVELYRDDVTKSLKTAAYRRERGAWIPCKGNQQCAMEAKRLIDLHAEPVK